VRFWDSSAIVPLIVTQPATAAAETEFDRNPALVVWWSCEIECISAISRLEREGKLGAGEVAAALGVLAELATSWQEVQPGARIRLLATRLLRTHPLRPADALQLAAAIVAADGDPHTLPVVTLDDRLALAANKEGFPVVVPE